VQYLVDANVLSEPTRPRPADIVVEWLQAHEAEVAVNPIILGELEYGILLLPAGHRRRRLEKWFAAGAKLLHILPLGAETAAEWARLLFDLKRRGRTMPVKDSLIAATARQHDLTVVTRNIADFAYAGVKLLDPFP
jgi:predicted nucleic acid-binding protein